MNVMELEVHGGIGQRSANWNFPRPASPTAGGCASASGLTPCRFPPTSRCIRYRAILRRTYFLGIMLRLEFELPSGLTLRSRMTKEEYAQLGLADGREVSFQIRNYRVLASDNAALTPELHAPYDPPPSIGENI